MAVVNPNFINEIRKFGGFNTTACFNCGNCTVMCPLSSGSESFPRKIIRYAQLGLEDKILQSTEPWLCYYCGECSTTCPRQAEPGEMMMALRRYLTSKYDWTGISRAIYTSKSAKFVLTIALALITGLLVWLLHGPIVLDTVDLTSFAVPEMAHNGGIIFGAILGILLLSNIGRMYWFTVKKGASQAHPPLSRYFTEFRHIIVQFLSQMRYASCTAKFSWANHMILMWGYTILFLLYAVFLPISIVNEWLPITNPIRIAGYFGFITLTYATVYAIIGRASKKEVFRKFSHSTDWMFLFLLLLTSITGILIHVFIGLGMPLATYLTFTIHLAVVVPLLALEVPFAKWSHLAYRPFGFYFSRLKTGFQE